VLRIEPLTFEVARGTYVRTTCYNGQIPGPLLRFPQGRQIAIEVRNALPFEDVVHWHGQLVSPNVDGVIELGTPPVPAHGTRTYGFEPQPAGTRWYHSHLAGGKDASRGTFTGEFGFFYVEPAHESARYDREIFLALHEWEPRLVVRSGHAGSAGAPTLAQPLSPMDQRISAGTGESMPMGGSANMMGRMPMMSMRMLEAEYGVFSVNGKALGFGEPIRVRTGERVMFRILNASATLTHRLTLPGHAFEIMALDGNPVPNPRSVDVVELGAGERVDALVTMDASGVWILGSTQDEFRRRGLGVVVEYANRIGPAQWSGAPAQPWRYSAFGRETASAMTGAVPVEIEQVMGTENRWTINGAGYPNARPLEFDSGSPAVMRLVNKSMMEHPMHLHGHVFELLSIDGAPTGGVLKDTVVVRPMLGEAIIKIVDRNVGQFLLHCHNELHMDGGLATVVMTGR